ncbi:MAG TPA: GNAT family N-acetyltransferase [Limnochordia bacterium]|nr:GNAT family N-acetyltransferase [Limnochordia bacterium]
MEYSFRKVDISTALKIVAWDYPPSYSMYNLHRSAVALERLVDGAYYAAFSGSDLMGFFCYGMAAQLNSKKDNVLYLPQGFLDVGLGMHPAWCSRGYGQGFVGAGLLFARNRGWTEGFRLTVAANNTRARKVYTRLGFQEVGEITWDSRATCGFLVMTLDTLKPALQAGTSD